MTDRHHAVPPVQAGHPLAAPTVLATLPLPEPAPSLLATAARVRVLGEIPSRDRLMEEVGSADVLCSQLRDTVDADVLNAGAGRLRAVCNYAAGYDNVDLEAATRHGILVTNTPDVLTNATADLTMGLIVATARRFTEGEREMRSGSYAGWRPDHLPGLELEGSRLGLVGFGRIAQAVARRAAAFGMSVIYHDARCEQTPEDLRHCLQVGLDELLSTSDVVSLHVPLTTETHHLVNRRRLNRMKRSAVLVNTSRGPVVDEAALVSALQEGSIAGAGLDVYEHEPRTSNGLAECLNSVLLPHLGSATVATRGRMAELVAKNALAALSGDRPPHPVNYEALQTD